MFTSLLVIYNLHDFCSDHYIRSLVTVLEMTMMTIIICITAVETWRLHISKILSQFFKKMHLCKQNRYWLKPAYLFFCCVIGVITTFTIIKFIYKAHSGWFEKACFMGAVIKHGARAVTPSAYSLFWKLESNAWEI